MDQKQASKIHYIHPKSDLHHPNNQDQISQIISEVKPAIPVYFFRENAIRRASQFFIQNFTSPQYQSSILYSVKSNPEDKVLKSLFNSGIRKFDVASIIEVKLVNRLFGSDVQMYFMHPIKSREAIAESYFEFGVRDFSLDSFDELDKILEVTNFAKDLNLHLRLSIPNSHSIMDLSGKFGILPSESVGLIRKMRAVSKNLGICFHVGSQCMEPVQYRAAVNIVKEVLEKSEVKIDVLDVGGGFPANYPGMEPQNLTTYFDEIFDAIAQINLEQDCEIWCEPGRALVAESQSLLVRVEARKGNMLYINDGTYGGLFDAGMPDFIYPTLAYRINPNSSLCDKTMGFGFYGPTCDSIDEMKGPFYLPENIAEGDYIEIGQLGAYSKTIRTKFNGFYESLEFDVSDDSMVTMYDQDSTHQAHKKISAEEQ